LWAASTPADCTDAATLAAGDLTELNPDNIISTVELIYKLQFVTIPYPRHCMQYIANPNIFLK